MKHIAIIGTILILLILTAGCLDDLSSTLPPCCDGTCDGVKTSVIHVTEKWYSPVQSGWFRYTVDSEGIYYAYDGSNAKEEIVPYFDHNVTFSYSMINGHRHITGIIEDHDVVKVCGCECVQKCCGCEGR